MEDWTTWDVVATLYIGVCMSLHTPHWTWMLWLLVIFPLSMMQLTATTTATTTTTMDARTVACFYQGMFLLLSLLPPPAYLLQVQFLVLYSVLDPEPSRDVFAWLKDKTQLAWANYQPRVTATQARVELQAAAAWTVVVERRQRWARMAMDMAIQWPYRTIVVLLPLALLLDLAVWSGGRVCRLDWLGWICALLKCVPVRMDGFWGGCLRWTDVLCRWLAKGWIIVANKWTCSSTSSSSLGGPNTDKAVVEHWRTRRLRRYDRRYYQHERHMASISANTQINHRRSGRSYGLRIRRRRSHRWAEEGSDCDGSDCSSQERAAAADYLDLDDESKDSNLGRHYRDRGSGNVETVAEMETIAEAETRCKMDAQGCSSWRSSLSNRFYACMALPKQSSYFLYWCFYKPTSSVAGLINALVTWMVVLFSPRLYLRLVMWLWHQVYTILLSRAKALVVAEAHASPSAGMGVPGEMEPRRPVEYTREAALEMLELIKAL